MEFRLLFHSLTIALAIGCIAEERGREAPDGQSNATVENQLNIRSDPDTRDPLAETFATAQLKGTTDNGITGSVSFHKGPNDQLVTTVNVSGVDVGKHGIHVHENGSCIDAGKAAGGHFAGSGIQHDAPESPYSHIGDLGNIYVETEEKWIETLHKPRPDRSDFVGWEAFIGKAVIIHAMADDLVGQPGGNAGPPIACGIIQRTVSDTSH